MSYADRIAKFLSKHPYQSFNAKQIALETGIKSKYVGPTCNRMVRRNQIVRSKRGYFQDPSALVRPKDAIPFFLHGIKLECRCYKQRGWSYLELDRFVTTRFAHPEMHRHKNNRSRVTKTYWEDRTVSITLHPSKMELLEVWCKSSNIPLTPIEFVAFISWLCGHFNIPAEHWIIKQKSFNMDFPNIRIEGGISEISAHIAQKQILRMYQKGFDFRLEIEDYVPINSKEMKDKIGLLLDAVNAVNGNKK